jgi:hypothetical protein
MTVEPLLLLQAVREVSLVADAEHPVSVSQRAFDVAATDEAAALPAAKHIAEKLRMPWREVLALAHKPSGTHNHALGRKDGSPEQDWLTPEYVGFVLRLVAKGLNTSTLTPGQYRVERERVLATDRKAWLHGRQLRLPNDEQIRIAAGDWDKALGLAGLNARAGRGDQGRGKYAASTADVLERCYEIHGTELTNKELWVFVKANGIPYGRERGRTWAECLAEWKEQRKEKGLPVPDGPPSLDERPDYARDVGAARPGEGRRQKWTKQEDCAAFVLLYLKQLVPGERSTKRRYDDWARAQHDAPNSSAFDQHGGWETIRSLASRQLISR